MDPLSITVSAITVAGAVGSAASLINRTRKDYRKAEEQISHADEQRTRVHSHIEQLSKLSPEIRSTFGESSFVNIESILPLAKGTLKKRDKAKWAIGGKSKTQDTVNKLKETEISAIATTGFNCLSELDAIKQNSSTTLQELAEIKDILADATVKSERPTPEVMMYMLQEILSRQDHLHARLQSSVNHCSLSIQQNKHSTAEAHQFDWLKEYFGITARLIISRDRNHKRYNFIFRWHMFCTLVFLSRFSIYGLWPSLQLLSIKPRRIIGDGSPIVEACMVGNIPKIQHLFSCGDAHPSDVTEANFTLLRFAIRSGKYEVVKLLLENGANPNLTFGGKETSPLNNAFLVGNARIIRLLLNQGADLEYINGRTWTCLSYLWDPVFNDYSDIGQIIQICKSQGFTGWNCGDMVGWAPIHRAAAFGKACHIEALEELQDQGVSLDQETILSNWNPLQCAVLHGNFSTFVYLSRRYSTSRLQKMADNRGWHLLHLAAEGGSSEIILWLLKMGCDTDIWTYPTCLQVPEELEELELSPGMIADYYGNGQKYNEALAATGILSGKEE